MSDSTPDPDVPSPADEFDIPEDAVPDDVPEWDDEHLNRVSNRLMFNYDLEKDRRVDGRTFVMYGEMHMESRKQFFLPSLNYANQERREHLFVRRADTVSKADLERLVELGHDLADEWINADEEHFGTDFTFVVVVPDVPEAVREFVAGFEDRTLLKYGYYGSYEVNLGVVAPDRHVAVESESADVVEAFRLWEQLQPREESGGLVRRLAKLLGR